MRFLARVFALVVAVSVGLTMFGSIADAEIVDEQKTWWGVEGEGDSRTMGRWSALTFATEQVGGTSFAGGKFLRATNGASSYNQPFLAAFDAGTGRFLDWFRPDVGGPVLALEKSSDGGLFVGGEMGEWDGTQIGAFQKIDPVSGKRWPGWNTRVYGGSSVVRDIRLESDGWLYVVGSFTTATEGNGPFSVGGAIRMDPVTGDIDENWLPQVSDGAAWGVARSQTKNEVYLAGWFTRINGNSGARGFAGVSSTDGSLRHTRTTIPYNGCAPGQGFCDSQSYYRLYDVVATEHGTVFTGGEQHGLFILDEDRDLAMTRMHYTGCNLRHQRNCDRRGGEYQEIERIGDRVYATCHCWGSHMSDTSTIYYDSRYPSGNYTGSISALAAYDPASGQRIQSFNPQMSGTAGGFSVSGASDGCLWIAGNINSVGEPGSQRSGRDLVRLCDAAGPGPDPQPDPTPPPVDRCSTSNNGTSATVSWPAHGGDSVVIERKVDNGNWSWRGSVTLPVTSFSETVPSGSVTTYRVLAKWGSTRSLPKTCNPPIDLAQNNAPVVAPVSCSASNQGVAASLTWVASPGATDYRVYRSIDGGTAFWRGKVSVTSFDDTMRVSGLHTYTVQARGADGVWSSSTTCSPALDPNNNNGGGGGGPVVAPVSCSASNQGVAASLTWVASPDATDYRVYRSIDGGTAFWRGKVSVTSFDDTMRVSGLHTYTVQARGADGVWSSSTTCSPALDPNNNAGGGGVGGPVVAPVSCSASNVGVQASLTWTASPGATDYRIFRSINGGASNWRGLVTTTTFADTLWNGGSFAYTVEARGADGVWSAATACSPALDPNNNAGGGGVGGPVVAPVSCSASNVGVAASLTWTASPGATDYRIFRSINGGASNWRGLVTTTTFADTLWNGGSFVYTVEARGADGVWSAATACNTLVTP